MNNEDILFKFTIHNCKDVFLQKAPYINFAHEPPLHILRIIWSDLMQSNSDFRNRIISEAAVFGMDVFNAATNVATKTKKVDVKKSKNTTTIVKKRREYVRLSGDDLKKGAERNVKACNMVLSYVKESPKTISQIREKLSELEGFNVRANTWNIMQKLKSEIKTLPDGRKALANN